MNTLVIDPVNTGNSHAAFNSSFIRAMAMCNEIESITLLIDRKQYNHSHFCYIKDNLNNVIPILNNNFFSRYKPINAFLSWSNAFLYYLKLIRFLHLNRIDILLFLAADNTFSPFLINLISSYLTKRRISLYIVFHNNLENLKNSPKKSIRWKNALVNKNVNVILLSRFLIKEAIKTFPDNNMIVIPHPTYAHLHAKPDLALNKKEKVDFLFLGRHSIKADLTGFLDYFILLCKKIELSENVEIKIRLLVRNDLRTINECDNIEVLVNPSTEHYFNSIISAKFGVFPPESSDRLSASGVIADLQTFGIPIIAPMEGPFKENYSFANYPFLYNDLSELPSLIQAAMMLSNSKYLQIHNEIRKKNESLSIENISKLIERVLIEKKQSH